MMLSVSAVEALLDQLPMRTHETVLYASLGVLWIVVLVLFARIEALRRHEVQLKSVVEVAKSYVDSEITKASSVVKVPMALFFQGENYQGDMEIARRKEHAHVATITVGNHAPLQVVSHYKSVFLTHPQYVLNVIVCGTYGREVLRRSLPAELYQDASGIPNLTREGAFLKFLLSEMGYEQGTFAVHLSVSIPCYVD